MNALTKLSSFRTQLTHIVKRCSTVDYTYKNYDVQRKDFAKVSEADVAFFESLIPGRVVTDKHELEANNVDWLHLVRGMSTLMLKPKTTDEVSQIVKYCNEKTLAICPQGGNTGLVGGSVPVFDEIIINMSLMNKVRAIDPVGGYAVCQSGVVLEQLDNELKEHNLMMPLDLGAKGSCHIGGNVSTNAGGLRYLRYGSLHGTVLGVEAVLADGTILDCLSTLKKDNTGYDLKQLFIGSEGTLGLVTAVSIAVPQRPKSVNLSFLGVDCYEDVQKTFIKAKNMLGEVLSAFEFLDASCMKVVNKNLGYDNPISEFPFYVLIETSGSNFDHDQEKLNDFLEVVMEEGVVLDGTVVSEPSKMIELWKIREGIAEALMHEDGPCFKYDISLPVKVMYDIVNELKEAYHDKTQMVLGYGHFGDGNLHLNVIANSYDREFLKVLELHVFSYTERYNGSISAEHGVGFKKANYIHYSRSPAAIHVMKQMKEMFDPKGILNPYKMLPR